MIIGKLFLERLQGEIGVTEISNLKENLGGLEKYDELIEKYDELYFLPFIPSNTWCGYKNYKELFRTKDHHVAGTYCFKVDFDVRANAYKETSKVITNDELMTYLPKLKEGLKSNILLADFNAIVSSGNGFHVYRISSKPIFINSEMYYGAAKILLETIKTIFVHEPVLYPDTACTNIARLMRLPGSINKKQKYGLPPQSVKVIELSDGDSELVGKLPELGTQFYTEKAKEIKAGLKQISKFYAGDCGLSYCPQRENMGLFGNNEACQLYNSINHDIDIGQLVCEYTGRTMAKNNKNFISNKDGGFTGAFIDREKNIVVWAGTPHIQDAYPVYSPFAFIKVHYANGSSYETFKRAKNRYSGLSHTKPRFYFGKGLL